MNSQVDIKEIIDTELFDYDKAALSSLWIKELESGWHATHVSEVDEYWITSFVYQRERPFHPQRFMEIANKNWPWVVRSKWIFWIASRNNVAGNWSLAGWSIKIDPMWRWMWSFSKEERTLYAPEWYLEYEKEFWNKPHWDRKNELVIIRVDMDENQITDFLDYALLTDQEMEHPEIWSYFPDPLPKWEMV